MIRIFLWGAGAFGTRILKHIPNELVKGYIETNEDKIGKKVNGFPVYSFEEFYKEFPDDYVLTTHSMPENAMAKMNEMGFHKYFLCNDCPPEWLEEARRLEFDKYVESLIISSNKLAVLGVNLFSIVLCDRIKKITGYMPDLLFDEDSDSNLITHLQKDLSEYVFVQLEKTDLSKYERIYNTEDDLKIARENIVEAKKCYKHIEEYRHEKIASLKGKHIGKRCFIVGLGPSLDIADLETLKKNNELCISMNSIYRIFEKTDWRPNYYVSCDTKFIMDEIDKYVSFDLDNYIISDTCGAEVNERLEELLGNKLFSFHEYKEWKLKGLPDFSDDISRSAAFSGTVTYTCMQIAAYMGCNEIYLLGMDASVIAGQNKTYEYFYENTGPKSYCQSSYPYRAYEAAKKYAGENGIIIKNASRGGELESFERVNFDSLF